jgi:hypothetical protein
MNMICERLDKRALVKTKSRVINGSTFLCARELAIIYYDYLITSEYKKSEVFVSNATPDAQSILMCFGLVSSKVALCV